ncbi:DUF4097 family beta strand repeat-containing protein [Kribbella sp. NPDC004875]|uniref:DUF4097 family beta strand repeat-containing protein n=1 Tax=Kribbella sp. NPDC004875 TaxID=3364107 RepID=UPI0036A7C41D
MTEREITVDTKDPVTLETGMRDRNGTIRVRVDPKCEQVSVQVTTSDPTGPSADAIAAGTLQWDEATRRLTVDIEAPGIDPRSGSKVYVTAVVPPDSNLDAHTHGAGVEVTGPEGLADAAVETTSGSVTIDEAATAYAKTVDGPVRISYADKIVVRSEGDFEQSFDHVAIGRAAEIDAATTGGRVRIDEVTGKLAVKTDRGPVDIDSLSADSSEVRTRSGNIDVRVTGGRRHQFTSGSGVATVTVEYTAPRDVQVQVSDIRGPGRAHLSEDFVERYRREDEGPTHAGGGAAAGAGAAPGAAAAAATAAPVAAPVAVVKQGVDRPRRDPGGHTR